MTETYRLKTFKKLVPMMWIEHMTSPLPRECSTTELHGLTFVPPFGYRFLPNSGAGEGNRTLVISLEGFCSAIELHPPLSTLSIHPKHFLLHRPHRCHRPESWWRGLDSNQRRRKANRFTVCPL